MLGEASRGTPSMIKWLLDKWHARQRAIDLEILWPECVKHGQDLDHAKAAFAYHAFNDEAWLCLGDEEIKRRIDNLK
jgi:hypothetical protein